MLGFASLSAALGRRSTQGRLRRRRCGREARALEAGPDGRARLSPPSPTIEDGWLTSGRGARLALVVALGGIAAWLAKARHTFPQSVRDARWFVEELLETVREPLLILDPQLRVRAANHPFYDKFRVSPEETENRLIYQLGNGQWDIPELRTLLERILPRNTFFDDFEVVHDFPVIGRKIMRLNTHRLQRYGRRFDLILVAIEDVTERVVAEQQRQAAETRFTSMVKNLKDHAIFLLDARACITSWNEASEQILGYREDEVLGREFSFIFTEEDIQAGVPEMEMRTAVEMGRVEDERWHVRKGGPPFWAVGIMTPLYDSEGQLTGYTKILRDMTAQKQAVAELDRVNEELQEASRRKDEFLALLAHELRNPLAPIRNGLQIVKTVISREGAGDAAIEMMERQLSQMVRLIDDLLDVSRINQGKLHLQTERVPLATLVQQAAEAIQPAIERMQQKLTVELPPEPVFLNVDPVRMAQVLSNLLTNSCKFTERGGRIRFSAWREGEEAVIRVQDTGIGIPAEKLASIFDMFVQVDRNAERSQGGLGLGLSLVKSLVEMHGGRVEAWSEGIGRGSEFIIRLPVVAEPAGEPRPAAKTAPATTSKMRILVVDDNRDAAQSLAMLLRLEGHDVRTVYDGPSALELASTFQPDIIFQDIGMPGMSGYEVGWRLRQGFSKGQMMLVALTGYGTEEDRRRTALAGFDLHLVKPVEPETLQHLVRAFAAKK